MASCLLNQFVPILWVLIVVFVFLYTCVLVCLSRYVCLCALVFAWVELLQMEETWYLACSINLF